MKNRKKLGLILTIIGLFLLVIGLSYAFFTANILGIREQKIVIGEDFIFSYNETSNGLSIKDEDILNIENGKISEKYFDFNVKLQTQYEKSVDYYIYLTKDETSTLDEDYIYTYLTDQNDIVLNDVTKMNELEKHETYNNSKYLYGNSISSNNNIETVHNYRLRVWVSDEYQSSYITSEEGNGSHLTTKEGRFYKFKVNVATGTINLEGNLANNWKDYTTNEASYLALYTINSKTLPTTYAYNNETYTLDSNYDISEQKNNSVLLGEYTNGSNIIAVIGQKEGVISPINSNNLFSNLTNITTLDLSNFDTTNVLDMSYAFKEDESLTEITVGCNYNIDNLTDVYTNSSIKKVIKVCNEKTTEEILQSEGNLSRAWLDKTENELNYLALYTLGSADLPNTYDYNGITYSLETTIDVSEQENGNVLLGEYKNGSNYIAIIGQEGKVIAPQDSQMLFSIKYASGTIQSNLKVLDVSNLDTSNVTNMSGMFYGCAMLTSLDLSNFDTTNVTSMHYMFWHCRCLANLDLTSFDTSKVTDMTEMFATCLSLTKIPVGCNWTTENATTTNMFKNAGVSSVTKVCEE